MGEKMNERISPMNIGDRITLGDEEYEITELLGSGSSFFSYKALRANSETVVIKEYVPFKLRKYCERDLLSNEIHLDNKYDKNILVNHCMMLFRDFKRIQTKVLREYSYLVPGDIEKIHQGNTMYLLYVWDEGWRVQELFENETTDIVQTLKILIVIAKAMMLLEEKNVYFTDCKANNIQISSDGKDGFKNVLFFDIDSLWSENPGGGFQKEKAYSYPYIPFSVYDEYAEDYLKLDYEQSLDHLSANEWHVFGLGMMLFLNVFKKRLESFGVSNESELWNKIKKFIDANFTGKNNMALIESIETEHMWQKEFVVKILDILKRSLDAREFYKLKDMLSDLEEAKQIYEQPVKSYATKAFMMVDRYPVFRFLDERNDSKEYDIALIGSHVARNIFLSAYMACVQHLVDVPPFGNKYIIGNKVCYFEASPTFRLFSEDSKAFFEQYLKDNPEMKNALIVYDCKEGQEPQDRGYVVDPELCRSPYAKIYLYDCDLNHLPKDISCSQYFIVLNNDAKQNDAIKSQLCKGREDEQIFIGIVEGKHAGRNYDPVEIEDDKPTIMYMVDAPNINIKEDRQLDVIIDKGFMVHMSYIRGVRDKWTDAKKAKDEFLEKKYNEYNYLSSLRAAASILYKLWSIEPVICNRGMLTGLLEDDKTPEEYLYQEIFSEESLYENAWFIALANLEHRSWCVWLAGNGYMRPSTYLKHDKKNSPEACERLVTNIFYENNQFRCLKKKVHTCLVSSFMPFDFQNDPEGNPREKGHDPLDTVSHDNRMLALKLAESNRSGIESRLLAVLSSKEHVNDPDLTKILMKYVDAVQNVLKGKNSDFQDWLATYWKDQYKPADRHNLRERLIDYASNNDIQDGLENKLIGDILIINKDLWPWLEYNKVHDFKGSDADIIKSLLMILTGMRKIVLHRPLYGSIFDVVIGATILEPDYLDLFAVNNKTDNIDKGKAMKIVNGFGRQPKEYALLWPPQEVLQSKDYIHVIDMTGIVGIKNTSRYQKHVQQKLNAKEVILMEAKKDAKKGEIEIVIQKGYEAHSLFGYPIRLGLKDLCTLYGVKEPEVIPRLNELDPIDAKTQAILDGLKEAGFDPDGINENVKFKEVDTSKLKKNVVAATLDNHLYIIIHNDYFTKEEIVGFENLRDKFDGRATLVVVAPSNLSNGEDFTFVGKETKLIKDIDEFVEDLNEIINEDDAR